MTWDIRYVDGSLVLHQEDSDITFSHDTENNGFSIKEWFDNGDVNCLTFNQNEKYEIVKFLNKALWKLTVRKTYLGSQDSGVLRLNEEDFDQLNAKLDHQQDIINSLYDRIQDLEYQVKDMGKLKVQNKTLQLAVNGLKKSIENGLDWHVRL